MHFRFLGLDSDGNIIRGTLYSNDEDSAHYELNSRGIDVKLLQENSHKTHTKVGISKKLYSIFRRKSFGLDWKFQFFQQLHVLLHSEIPIERALSIIIDEYDKNSGEYELFSDILNNIRSGRPLSEAMSVSSDKFSYAEINIIRAAERVGRPQDAIGKLCDFSKTVSSVKRKIVISMIYPAIVMIVAFCVLSILSIVVVPRFQEMFFEQCQHKLPLLTRVVVSMCEFFKNHALMVIVASIFAYFLCKNFFKKIMKRKISSFANKIPFVGEIIKGYNLYLFSSAAFMLLSCGVTLQESLSVAKNAIPNPNIKNTCECAIERLRHGELLSYAMADILSKFALAMILVGEQTGKLDTSFSEISQYYRSALVTKLTVLSSLVEPMLITMLAILVGIIVVAIFLPMVDIMQSIGT